MSAKAESSAAKQPATPAIEKPPRVPLRKLSGDEVRTRVKELDEEIGELVQAAINGIAPGRGFDRNLLRQMTKAQREKNRLVAARFTALLDMGHPEAKELLGKLMQIPG